MSVEKQAEEAVIEEDSMKEEEVEVDVKLEETEPDNATESPQVEAQEHTEDEQPLQVEEEAKGQEAEPSSGKQGKTKFQKRIDDLTKRQREAERQRDE
jgi:acyl dehydratase